jgi:predicted outer membrane repeat protein
LRQALTNANNGFTINFAVTGTILLTSGELHVTKSVTISGPGSNQLSIDGNQAPYVFYVDSPAAIATISGLTIRNGGYGIGTVGTLTVSNCTVTGNSQGIANNGNNLTVVNSNVSNNDHSGISFTASGFVVLTATIRNTTVSDNLEGGIVANIGVFMGTSLNVTIADCTISGNSLFGGIHCEGAPNLAVINSTISGNSANAGFPAGDMGGGIHCDNGLSVENSTVSGNSAATSGGGIYAVFTEIVNSTISGNSAGTSGGGIYTDTGASLRVANSTVTGNSAPSGGGIYNEQLSGLEISNTLLNAGALGENIFNNGGTVTSDGYNLSSDDGGGYLNGPGDQINIDPLLGPLQDNGGETFTHALLPGSPAIDAGDPNFSPPPFNDQRGCPFDRVSNGRMDIGSFETQLPPRRPVPCERSRPTPAPRP